MKLIKRKLKKIMRSSINRRLFKSFRRLGIFLFGFSLIFSLNQAQKTNSFFFDGSSIENNSFSAGYWVVPKVKITNPESGDEWQVGSTHQIQWTVDVSDPAATVDDVVLDYTCDDGATYNSINTFSGNPSSYDWTVPENISDQCRIRVTATDSHGLTGMDDSDKFDVSYMVVLNEFVPHPASGLDEMVEIYNYGTEPVDIDNWFITDDNGPAMHRRVINSAHSDTGSTVIDPGTNRFLVVEDYDSFYLNDAGSDEVRLYDDASNLIDSEGFEDAPEGKSYARIPDGVGNWVDPVPTPGEKNDPSNDPEDMKEFYEKACFDENNELICKESFLKSLGLLDEKEDEEENNPEDEEGDETDENENLKNNNKNEEGPDSNKNSENESDNGDSNENKTLENPEENLIQENEDTENSSGDNVNSSENEINIEEINNESGNKENENNEEVLGEDETIEENGEESEENENTEEEKKTVENSSEEKDSQSENSDEDSIENNSSEDEEKTGEEADGKKLEDEKAEENLEDKKKEAENENEENDGADSEEEEAKQEENEEEKEAESEENEKDEKSKVEEDSEEEEKDKEVKKEDEGDELEDSKK